MLLCKVVAEKLKEKLKQWECDHVEADRTVL